jgi:hypothetical protein
MVRIASDFKSRPSLQAGERISAESSELAVEVLTWHL